MPRTLRYARQATHVTHGARNVSERHDAVSKIIVEHVKHVIGVAQFVILKSKSYSLKPRWIFPILLIRSRDITLQILSIVLFLRYPQSRYSREIHTEKNFDVGIAKLVW